MPGKSVPASTDIDCSSRLTIERCVLFFYEGERQMIACNESSPGETRISQAGPRLTAKS